MHQKNEEEIVEQINQQTYILEEYKAFKIFQNPRAGELFLAPSFNPSKQRGESPSFLPVLNLPDKAELSVPGPPLVTVKYAALLPKDRASPHLFQKFQPVTLFLEGKGGPYQSATIKELSKTERMCTQMNVACKVSNYLISKTAP